MGRKYFSGHIRYGLSKQWPRIFLMFAHCSPNVAQQKLMLCCTGMVALPVALFLPDIHHPLYKEYELKRKKRYIRFVLIPSIYLIITFSPALISLSEHTTQSTQQTGLICNSELAIYEIHACINTRRIPCCSISIIRLNMNVTLRRN